MESTVGDIEYLEIAREMARSHHERWDGKGYPDIVSAFVASREEIKRVVKEYEM